MPTAAVCAIGWDNDARFIIDADACPVKQRPERVATASQGTECMWCPNAGWRPSQNPLVRNGDCPRRPPTIADIWIADRAPWRCGGHGRYPPSGALAAKRATACLKTHGESARPGQYAVTYWQRRGSEMTEPARAHDSVPSGQVGKGFTKCDRSQFSGKTLERELRAAQR